MSTANGVERDERTEAVENASYRIGWFLLYTGLLWDGCYRVYVRQEMPIDLMVLALGSAAFCTLYQVRHKVLTRGRFKKMLRIGLIFGVLGAIWALIWTWLRG